MSGYLQIVSFEAIPQIVPSETGILISKDDDINSLNQWYHWTSVHTKVETKQAITAMEAWIPYWYQQRNQWYHWTDGNLSEDSYTWIPYWYQHSEPVIRTELEWGVNTNVKTKQAGNSYGGFDILLISTEEPVIHTEPKEVYLKDSDTKSMIPTYRRGQL